MVLIIYLYINAHVTCLFQQCLKGDYLDGKRNPVQGFFSQIKVSQLLVK